MSEAALISIELGEIRHVLSAAAEYVTRSLMWHLISVKDRTNIYKIRLYPFARFYKLAFLLTVRARPTGAPGNSFCYKPFSKPANEEGLLKSSVDNKKAPSSSETGVFGIFYPYTSFSFNHYFLSN